MGNEWQWHMLKSLADYTKDYLITKKSVKITKTDGSTLEGKVENRTMGSANQLFGQWDPEEIILYLEIESVKIYYKDIANWEPN